MPLKYKLLLSYDGTNYSGWQVQPNASSIQTHLQKALSTILRTPISISGSGRTDSGVHALGQVAHFTHSTPIIPRELQHSLNGLLPQDIRVLSIEKVTEDFHARYSATGKLYLYHLHTSPDPFKRLYSYLLPFSINIGLLKKAAALFVGTHDFTSFSNEAHLGSASRNPVRTIKRLDIVEKENAITLEFEGDGFLYKMVRNISGTLLDVARGKIPVDEIPKILKAKDRREAGTTAPAHGLFLAEVFYPRKVLGIAENEE